MLTTGMPSHAERMTGPTRSRRIAGSPRPVVKWAVVPAAVGASIAVPVATWWLVGDQSTLPTSADLDYVVEPLDLGPGTERAAGIISTTLAVIALLILVLAWRRRQLDPRWWIALAPLLTAGVIVGYGWRVMTAGVIGANIGAGLVVVFCCPLVAVLLVWALAYSVYLWRRSRRTAINQ
jgi:hypothetical protein